MRQVLAPAPMTTGLATLGLTTRRVSRASNQGPQPVSTGSRIGTMLQYRGDRCMKTTLSQTTHQTRTNNSPFLLPMILYHPPFSITHHHPLISCFVFLFTHLYIREKRACSPFLRYPIVLPKQSCAPAVFLQTIVISVTFLLSYLPLVITPSLF